jgi:putative transposase
MAAGCRNVGFPPSYDVVHAVIRSLPTSLTTLAHEGSKAYSEHFDLVYRREAEGPNAIWQADHTLLDILLVREGKEPAKPWLTTIIDDYSRAIAGYFFSFDAPCALHTSLALRQAIWRKEDPRWHVCGIPQILYSDNGSDFTSHHLEQVSADLKIRLVNSLPGKPRGRGRIERFFETITQMLLCELPGYAPSGGTIRGKPQWTLQDIEARFRDFLLGVYHVRVHGDTKMPPQARWEAGAFLPHMPESLEQLDLLLLTVPKTRKVHPDGIWFLGMRYIDPTLAAYVGEEVLLRYDPRDIAEVRVFYQDRFLCRAICQELAGETVPLREIIRARNHRRKELRQTIQDRQRTVDTLLELRRWSPQKEEPSPPAPEAEPKPPPLKRYYNE